MNPSNSSFEAFSEAGRASIDALLRIGEVGDEDNATYRQLFDFIQDGFGVHEMLYDEHGRACDYRFLELNPAFERLTGLVVEETVGKRVREVLPEIESYWIELYADVVASGHPARCVQYSGPLDTTFEVFAYRTSPDHFAVIFTDVTSYVDRGRENELLRAAVMQANDAVVIVDAQRRPVFGNHRWLELRGAEAINATAIPDFLRVHLDAYSDRVAPSWQGRCVERDASGLPRDIEASITPVSNDHGALTHYVCVCRDVSHEEALRQQLRQSQKLESLGTLAGGIAHDFNNVLQGIVASLEMASRRPHDSRYFDNARQYCDRGRELIGSLLQFCRRGAQDREVLCISDVVAECVGMLRALLPRGIHLTVDGMDRSDLMRGNGGQLHQVLMNLIINARDAMQADGGTIHIAIGTRELDEAAAHLLGIAAGHYAAIAVEDQGPGIDIEVRERMFDPFFTTKERGTGSGLGLAVSYGIVREHGGAIDVSSAPGTGATFTVLLPVV